MYRQLCNIVNLGRTLYGHLLLCRAPWSLRYWEEHAACWSPSCASHHTTWHCCLSPAQESLGTGYWVVLGCSAVPGERCPRAGTPNGLCGSQHMLYHYGHSSMAAWLWATSCGGIQHTYHTTLDMCRYDQMLISPISITNCRSKWHNWSSRYLKKSVYLTSKETSPWRKDLHVCLEEPE